MEQFPRKLAAFYIRVSTDKQEELSPDAQKRLLMDYAKTHNMIVKEEHIYMEHSISGRSAKKRPMFQAMIATAKRKPKPFDLILIWKFSRFARNQEESIVYKSLLRKQCNIEVISVSEPLIEGPFGSLIERIIEWMDEYYSTRLSGEVFRGMSEKALRGGFQTRPPFGYYLEKNGEIPLACEQESFVVQLIFQKFVEERNSCYTIARYLNKLGYKTSSGNPFELRSISYILQNPFYIGQIRWNCTEHSTSLQKPPEEWIVADGKHVPIVSKDIFMKAQALLHSKKQLPAHRPSSTYKHWLSGILKCSACGRTLTISTHYKQTKEGSRTPYYSFNCYGYAKGKCFISHSISTTKVEKAIFSLFHTQKNLITPISFYPKPSTIYHSQLELERHTLQSAIKEVKQKEKRITLAYQNGIDTLEEYCANKLSLKQEREELEQRLHQLETDNKEETSKSALPYLSSISNLLQNTSLSIEEKSTAIQSIISHIVFQKEKQCLIVFYDFNENI